MFKYPTPRHSRTSPRTPIKRVTLLACLVGVLIFILCGCVLPTIDISQRQQIPGTAIQDALNSSIFCNDIHLLDSRYIAYTQSELAACLDTAGWIAELEYKPEFYDCEEFAFDTVAYVRSKLQGIPFGIGLRETETTHAENLFVDNLLNVWVVDVRRHGSELIDASDAFYFLVMI